MLFYVNGALEGAFALQCWFNPESVIPKEKIGQHGKVFASLYAPLLFGFSVASLYMQREPPSDAKNIFTIGWIIYHLSAANNVIQRIIKGQGIDNPDKMVLLIHSSLFVLMVRYLQQNNFNLKKLLFQ